MTAKAFPRSADVLADLIEDEPKGTAKPEPERLLALAREAKIAADEKQKIDIGRSAVEADAKIYRIVVAGLSAAMLLVIISILAISIVQMLRVEPASAGGVITFNFNIPDGLIALGSAAVGALAGLLAPTVSRR